MKKEFDLKIEGGTLESIKIDSSSSLIIATYKRDVAEFKAGDILIDAYDEGKFVSIFKEINKDKGGTFSAHIVLDIFDTSGENIGFDSPNWDHIENNRLATEEEKQLLFDALKKDGLKWNADKLEIEKLDISEIVVDYESAIKYLGIKDTLLLFIKRDRANKFNTQIKLQIIAEAWNKFDGFKADWENLDQHKHYPIFKAEDGKLEFSHTIFIRRTLDSHTSIFSFKTEERAKQFAEQFIDLFKVAFGI